MVYNLNKEPCNCCNRPIYISQSIAECSACDKIIHGKCFNDSNFLFVNNMFTNNRPIYIISVISSAVQSSKYIQSAHDSVKNVLNCGSSKMGIAELSNKT